MAFQISFETSQTRPKESYFKQSIIKESNSSLHLSSKTAWYKNTSDIVEHSYQEFAKSYIVGRQSQYLYKSDNRNRTRSSNARTYNYKFNNSVSSNDDICSLFAKRAENRPNSEGFNKLLVQQLYRKFSRCNPRSQFEFNYRSKTQETISDRQPVRGTKHVCGRNHSNGRVSFS